MMPFLFFRQKTIANKGLRNIKLILLLAVCATFLFFFVSQRISDRASRRTPLNCTSYGERLLFGVANSAVRGRGVGNVIFELISFIGISKAIGRTPALDINNKEHISVMFNKYLPLFPNLFQGMIMRNAKNSVSVEFRTEGAAKFKEFKSIFEKYKEEPWISVTFPFMQSFKYFESLSRDEIFSILAFQPNHTKIAKTQIIPGKNLNNSHNLCVQVRRGDFQVSDMAMTQRYSTVAGIKFIHNIASKKYENVQTIILGNDRKWAVNVVEQGNFTFPVEVRRPSGDWPPHIDWVFSSLYCDTIYLTAAASTYGWWMSYVSRGRNTNQTTYYLDKIENSPPNLIPWFKTTVTERPPPPDCTIVSYKGERLLFGEIRAINRNSGIGNIVFEIISFIGIAKAIGRTPALDIANNKHLSKLIGKVLDKFPNLFEGIIVRDARNSVSVNFTTEGAAKFTEFKKFFENYADEPRISINLQYMQSFKYFENLSRGEILSLLQFRSEHILIAGTEIVPDMNYANTHNLCVHVRRGDFFDSPMEMSRQRATIPGIKFVHKLVSAKHENITTIIVGDSRTFGLDLVVKAKFSFPVEVGKKNVSDWPHHIDWIFSSLYCDTLFLTAGASTYGWWLSYFSRGRSRNATTYYFDKMFKTQALEHSLMDRKAYFTPDFVPLLYFKENRTVAFAKEHSY